MAKDTVTVNTTVNQVIVTDTTPNDNIIIVSDRVSIPGETGPSGSIGETGLEGPTGPEGPPGSDTPGTVSSSIQVDHDETTNFESDEHFLQSAITEVGTVITGDITTILPENTISGSVQFDDGSAPFSGSFSGSFEGDGSNLTGVVSAGVVSGSSQIDHNLTSNYSASRHFLQSEITEVGTVITGDVSTILPTGTVSGSDQLPAGSVSGSIQVDHDGTLNFTASEHFEQSAIVEVGTVVTGDISTILPAGSISGSDQLPLNIVSGSIQVDHDATLNFTASEHFEQSAITEVGTVIAGDVTTILPTGTVSGSDQLPLGTVSGSVQVDHDETANYESDEHFLQSAITEVGTVITGDVSTILPAGSVSGSDQLPLNVVSSSIQVDFDELTNLPADLVSSSAQFDGTDDVTFGKITGSDGLFSGDVVVGGILTAREIHTELVSGSIIYESGSTKFGDTGDDLHERTGSLEVSGSMTVVGPFTADLTTSLPDDTVSGSIQVDHDATTNYDSDEHFLQSAITEVGTVITGDVDAILPAGSVSGSIQVDHDATTNFDAQEHFTSASITEFGTIVTGDVATILPADTVSGSAQFDSGDDVTFGTASFTEASASFSGSFTGDGSGLTGVDADPASGTVSGSIQVDHDVTTNYDSSKHFLQSEITEVGTVIAGDVKGITLGYVSSSVQIDHNSTTNFDSNEHFTQGDITTVGTVTTGDVATILPSGTVSGSAQFVDGTEPFSGSFSGSFYGDGSNITGVGADPGLLPVGTVSGSIQVDHDETLNFESDEHYTQADITTVGTVDTGDIVGILPTGTVSGSDQVVLVASASHAEFAVTASHALNSSGGTVAAEDVLAGTFGSGSYIINGGLNVDSNVSTEGTGSTEILRLSGSDIPLPDASYTFYTYLTNQGMLADVGERYTIMEFGDSGSANTGSYLGISTDDDSDNWELVFRSSDIGGVGGADPTASISWNLSGDADSNGYRTIVWSDNLSLLVACSPSPGTSAAFTTSPNGTDWTSRTGAGGGAWEGLAYSEDLGIFVAVGETGTNNRAVSSTNGTSWSVTSGGVDNIGWREVVYGSGSSGGWFVACAITTTTNQLMRSSTGTSWTMLAAPEENNWIAVTYSPSLDRYVIIAQTGTHRAAYSDNGGATWTNSDIVPAEAWQSVCWSPKLGVFCAVAYNDSSGGVMTSPDGITWTQGVTPTGINKHFVAWSEEAAVFVIVVHAGSGDKSLFSKDGLVWTSVATPGGGSDQYLGVVWANPLGKFVSVSAVDNAMTFEAGIAALGYSEQSSSLGTAEGVAPESGSVYEFRVDVPTGDGDIVWSVTKDSGTEVTASVTPMSEWSSYFNNDILTYGDDGALENSGSRLSDVLRIFTGSVDLSTVRSTIGEIYDWSGSLTSTVGGEVHANVLLETDGAVSIRSSSVAPSTKEAYGQMYVNDSGVLKFLSAAGTSYTIDLTED